MDPSDLELTQLARKGDRQAFHQLVDRHAPRLFGLALMLVGNRADAEDIVQETLLGAYQHMGRFESRSSVATWLSRILVKQAARHRRRWWRRRTEPLTDEHAAPDSSASVDARVDVPALLARLEPEHRQMIVLREIEGLSYSEIALVLELSIGTVESRLFRARRAMQALEEDGDKP